MVLSRGAGALVRGPNAACNAMASSSQGPPQVGKFGGGEAVAIDTAALPHCQISKPGSAFGFGAGLYPLLSLG